MKMPLKLSQSNTNPFVCILFAFIGALIGTIPNILVMSTLISFPECYSDDLRLPEINYPLLLQLRVALLNLLVPYAAFFGWRFAKGKPSVFAGYMILMVSLIAVFSSFVLMIALPHTDLSVENIMTLISDVIPITLFVLLITFWLSFNGFEIIWFGLLCVIIVVILMWKKMTLPDSQKAEDSITGEKQSDPPVSAN